MAKYNVKREPVVKVTTTHEGEKGLTQRPEVELIGILSTGIQNTFYEQESEREIRLKSLVDTLAKKDKTFVAKALVYARSVFGQRTVTHLGAVNLMPHLSGDPLAKRFFTKRSRKENVGGIVYRIDDMSEILSCYLAKNGQDAPIPNALKKGFRDAIENSDAYEIAKYQAKGRGVSLVDIVNLVHPRETEKNGTVKVTEEEYLKATSGTKFVSKTYAISEDGMVVLPTLKALVLGILKQFNTVEDKNTEAGQVVTAKVISGELSKEEGEKVLLEKKTENYEELINSKKIGYLALIRNLRNILKTGNSELLDKACELLVNKDFIRKSLVWPIHIDLALEIMLLEFSGVPMAKVTKALDMAYELSIPNLQHLLPEGRTAVVFDTSGSMQGGWSKIFIDKKTSINKAPAEKAALVAATFAKGVYGDVYHFASKSARITGWNPNDSINTLKREFMSHNGECGHGTDFGSCFSLFEELNERYDRVLIISDEQDGHGNVERSYKSYCEKFGTPYVYIINVCGYEATSPIKSGQRVFRLFGYSTNIYEKIPEVEINPNVVIEEINKIEI